MPGRSRRSVARSALPALLLATASAARADIFVIDDFDGGADPRLISRVITPANGSPRFPGSAFDVFGPTDRSVSHDLADDSASSFPSDAFGIAPSGKTDAFFAVEDLANPDHPGGGGSAVWRFDVSGLSGLSVSIVFSAMGDFEAGDNAHTFAFWLDGAFAGQVAIGTNTAASFGYAMEGGAVVPLDDPLELTDDLETRTIDTGFTTASLSALAGTGEILEIVYTAATNDGGGEVFAFDDLVLATGVAAPTPREIPELQGAGESTPFAGQWIETTGVVACDFQGVAGGSGELGGFFLQAVPGDGDAATSDGVFVASAQVDVAAGDLVTVVGRVVERAGHTEIGSVTSIAIGAGGVGVTETPVALPEPYDDFLERYEGMRIEIATPMTIQQNFFQGRYGQLTLGSPDDLGLPGRLFQPTDRFDAGTPAAIAHADANQRRLLVLDDGEDVFAFGDDPVPVPWLSQPAGDPPLFAPAVLRAGDAVTNLVGCLDSGLVTTPSAPRRDYRLHPIAAPVFVPGNPRPPPPVVVGDLTIASFNLHNWFTTLGSRGASTASERTRQRDKLVAALLALDAGVVGLTELQNNAAAIADLVAGLDAVAGPGSHAWIDTGAIGSDLIRVAFMYRPDLVTPVGSFAILDDAVDPSAITTRNRPALAQTFQEIASGERFTAVINHWKSKGSGCDVASPGTYEIADPDLGDGQGNCNLTRVSMANALLAWIATDPTASGDPDFLILGDLNAYRMEDPVQALEAGGFTVLPELFGAGGWSYVFDGQSGRLDHALASPSLLGQVTGAQEWHINADEPAVIDYDEDFNPTGYYTADAFRASDHDPVVVAVALPEPAPASALASGAALLVALARGRGRRAARLRRGPIAATGSALPAPPTRRARRRGTGRRR
jgi:predicted extracellular nuclease